VRGYPSLKFFRNGNPIDYEGGRTAQDILAFINRKSGPASTVLDSAAALEEFVGRTGTHIVGYFDGADEAHTKTWLDACKSAQFEDFGCGHVTDSSLFTGMKVPTAQIRKEGEDAITLTGDFTKENLVAWASAEGHPLVSELAQQVWQRSQTSKTPLVALFYTEVNAETTAQARDLAVKFKGKATVSITPTVSIAERWGASGKKLPTAVLVKFVDDGAKFVIFNEETEEFTAATAENFVAKGLVGEYKGFKKSEPIPESNDGPVKTLVARNFEQIAYDKTKDVFVEFYAPWCGHCKKLTPIWDELGTAFKADESVVIAKMDATANSVPEELDVRGFPTLIFFSADNKKGTPYSGERDLPSLKKFVVDQASIKIGDRKDEL